MRAPRDMNFLEIVLFLFSVGYISWPDDSRGGPWPAARGADLKRRI